MKRKTSYATVKKKIEGKLKKGALLCDIRLTEDEYAVLALYGAKCIQGRYPISGKSSTLALFLVATGQRYYDGSFWDHVSDAVGFAVPYKAQQKLGDAFYEYALSKGLTVFGREERVRNIMAQVFLPLGFENDFFSFLFYRYFVDLNCNISSLDTSFLSLGEEVARSHLVTRGTLDFIAANEKYASIRVKRMFSVMDKVFRLELLPQKLSARDKRLIAWCSKDATFRRESKSRNFSDRAGLKGAFTSPYVEQSEGKAFLWLPSVIFRNEGSMPDVTWYLDGEVISYPACELSITGIKTEIVRLEMEKAPPKGSIITVRCGHTVQSFTL